MFLANIHQLLNYSISIISLIFRFNMLFCTLFNMPLFPYLLSAQNPLPKAKRDRDPVVTEYTIPL